MKTNKSFRPKTFDEFLSFFVAKPNFSFVKRGKFYYLKNEALQEVIVKINATPSYEGLVLGKEEQFFEPSLFLLELLSKETNNKVFVNAQAEWLFLCGRDVFPESVEKNNSKNIIFLVQNSKDENLGLGMKTKHKGKNIIKNLKDRGDFLRREK
jgi:ribosome biogenesis protein Nip4